MSSKPLLLHAHGSGPNPYKIAIALEILDVPYEVKLWQMSGEKDGMKGSEFLKINENGRVPALEDPNTGVTSWESLACMNYLLRVYDKSNKLGPGDKEQDKVDFDKWTSFLISTLGPMQGQVNWFKHFNAEKNENALQRYVGQTNTYYAVLEGHLKKQGGSYILAGSKPTAVDLHFYAWIKLHGFAGIEIDQYPSIKEWFDNLGEMKEVKAAYEKVPKGQAA